MLRPLTGSAPHKSSPSKRSNRVCQLLRLLIAALVFIPAALLTATGDASTEVQPDVQRVSRRKIIVEVTATEPASGFIRNITVELVYGPKDNPISIVAPGTAELRRSGDRFTREYEVPDAVLAGIRGTLRVNTTDAVNPTYTLLTEEMDFTRGDSADFTVVRALRFVPLRIEAVERVMDSGGATVDNPVAANVRIRRRVGDNYVNVAVAGHARFTAGVTNTYLPADPFTLPWGTTLDVEGRLSTPRGFDLFHLTQVTIPETGGLTARLVFFNWEAQVRTALFDALFVAGISQATARTICEVMVLPDPGVTIAEWRVNSRYYIAYIWEGAYYIGLNGSFNPTEPNGGDSLMHEWIHETLYRSGWNAPDPPNTRHNCEVPASVETLAYEEGLAHFLGSHLLTRILRRNTVLGYSTAPCWLDNPADRLRALALTYRNQANANNPDGAVMKNPGSWIEGIWAGALLEMLTEMGINVEREPENALRLMITDLGAFCAATGSANRTPENFFIYRRQHPRNLIARFEGRVVDQMALWYLLTTRPNVADIEHLVPTALAVNGAARVTAGAAARFTASVRAFHRLAETRTYNRITLRLVEGSTILVRDVALQPHVAGAFNYTADLQARWNTPGDHRLRAEVWGDFIDGTAERIGTSDEVTITVEKETPAEISVRIDPPSATLDPEAKQNFTATVTGTTNQEIQWVATDYQGQEYTAGKLTKTAPNAILYQAPSYPGTYTLTATSRADAKKSAKATITVKSVAVESGIPYGTTIEHLPCVWEIKTTCDNNRVAYSVFRTESSSKLVIKQILPNGLTLDSVKDLPLSVAVEYEGLTPLDDKTNCPPSRVQKTGSGGKLYYSDRSGLGSAPKLSSSLMIDAATPAVKIYLEVTDNVERPPIYKWNYKRGDRWLLYGGALPLCTKDGVATGETGKPYDPGTGVKPVQPAPPLYVNLKPDKTSLNFGEIIKVRAEVSGGRADTPADYQFAWQGEHAGTGAQVQFTSRKPGQHPLAVTVTDKDGKTATARVTLTVGGARVEIVKLDPPGKVMVYGRKANFSARLVGAQIKNYIYRWEPQETVTFSNPEGVEGVANQTSADFKRPGKLKVWVSVLEQIGETLNTIAESDPIELDVGPPVVSILFDPPVPFIGQVTKAKIVLQDKLAPDRIDFRWTPPANALVLAESQDKRDLTFLPKDAAPITFKVIARVPHYGDDLGEISGTLAAKAYDVQAIVIGQTAEKVEGAELVKKPTAIAVSQGMIIRASITPQPLAGKVRFVWYVKQDGLNQFVGENFGTEVVVQRNGVGTCEVVVEAEDTNGIKLGRGATVFTVAISKAEIEAAKKTRTAADKVTSAKTLERKGQMDEAILLVDEALLLDPANAEAAALAKKWKSDRAIILEKLEAVKRLMAEARFIDAQKELVIAQNLNMSYKPVVETTNLLGETWRKWDYEVQDGIYKISDASKRREFKRALELAARLRATMKLGVYEDELQQEEVWAQKWEAEKEAKRQVLKAGEAKFQQYDYDGALKDFEAGFLNHNILWAMSDPEPNYFNKLRAEATTRRNRINELMSAIQRTADEVNTPINIVEINIKNADEVLTLQPNNTEAKRYRALLEARLKARGAKTTAAGFIKQGQDFYDQTKYSEAIAAYTKAIAADANSAEAYAGRGNARRAAKDVAGALADFSQAIQLDPRSSEAYRGRSMVKRGQNDFNGALADGNKAVEFAPNFDRAYLTRGLARESLKDLDGALADYNRAIQLNPNYPMSYFYRGKARLDTKDSAGALADFNRFIQANPNDSPAHNNRGLAKERLGDIQGAISDYERAIAINPNSEIAKKNLARVLATRTTSSSTGASFYPLDLSGVGGKKGQPRTVRSIEVDDGSYIRLKSTDEKRLTLEIPLATPVQASAVALICNLDDATYLPQGKTIARLTLIKDTGEERFDIQAGVQASEWNYSGNAKHRWVEEGAVGKDRFLTTFRLSRPGLVRAVRFDYVETGVEPSMGHTPGFCLRGVTLMGAGASVPETTKTEVKPPEPTGVVGTQLFNNGNLGGVANSPTQPTVFTLNQAHMITQIQNYHWNNGRGARPGTVALRDGNGRLYGPWTVIPSAGQGGAPNVYWTCSPNVVIPAGTYTVVDSDPATWSQNGQSGGRGFSLIKGYPVSQKPVDKPQAPTTGDKRPAASLVTAIFENKSGENIHIFAEGETMSLANRLAPGESRKVNVKMPPDGRIKFYAGRNGQVIASKFWNGDPDNLNRYPRVTFDGSGQLLVLTGLR